MRQRTTARAPRDFSAPWQPGDKAQVTPVKYGTPARGKVVYCKHLAENRYWSDCISAAPGAMVTFAYPGIW